MDAVAAQIETARNAILACDYEQAAAACREALAVFGKHVEATCLLGEAYRELGRASEAEDLLRRVLSADPENVLANWALGLLLRDQERDQEALASLSCAHELAPANAELVNDLLSVTTDLKVLRTTTPALLGRTYAAAGLNERAAAEFRAALLENPRRLDVWVALAESLWRAGDQPEAREVCEAILAEAPHCLKALLILASIRRAEGDIATADNLLSLAHELDPAGSALARLT